jgi:hypothetical protein
LSIWKPKNLKEMILHDAGHAVTGLGVVVLLTWMQVPLFWACLAGAVGAAIVQEAVDFVTWAGAKEISTDSIHDIGTYQPAWMPYLVVTENWLGLFLVLLLVAIVEMSYYRIKIKV